MDPTYEAEEMETNMESMFEHVNEMWNTDMPRDYLASMSRHFFLEEGEKYTTFQKFQTEACLLLEQRRPNWRKRKTKSASQFITSFYMIEKDVLESDDDVLKSLFVEAFNSREAYIENVMDEFDETDRIEEMMSSGTTIKIPGYVYDDGDDNDDEPAREERVEFDFDKCVLEIAGILDGLDHIEQSKYVKIFEKDGDSRVGIYNSRMKALAKTKAMTLSQFPPAKNYPRHVKSGTQAFTKLTASSSVGQGNTSAGYCMLINIHHLDVEARQKLLEVLGKEDLEAADNLHENTCNDEDLLPSQDFPNHYQSQTSETLLHCTLCEFLSRSKPDFEAHMRSHPNCNFCKKKFETIVVLEEHIRDKHTPEKTKCTVCGKEVAETELAKHKKEHEIFNSFKKALDKPGKKVMKKKDESKGEGSKTKPKSKNCYTVFVEENRPVLKQNYPTMTPNDITKRLSELWKNLSEEEKTAYKLKATEFNNSNKEADKKHFACPKCDKTFETSDELVRHLVETHVENSAVETSTVLPNVVSQHTINQCRKCGNVFYGETRLKQHMLKDHPEQENVILETDDVDNVVTDENNGLEENMEAEGNSGEQERNELVMVKIVNLYWPAKIIKKIDGEITEIEMFDDEKTRKTVEHIKLKPFEKLVKVPAKRSKAWKEAYEKAVMEFED